MGSHLIEESSFNSYKDTELERLLKESKENDYANILRIWDSIVEKLRQETAQNFAAKDAQLNAEIKKYYVRILIESILDYVYSLLFGASFFKSTTKESLAQKQTDLQNWLAANLKEIYAELQPIEERVKTIAKLKNAILDMEIILSEVEGIIDQIDQKLQNKQTTNEVKITLEQGLEEHLERRKRLETEILKSYRDIDQNMKDLTQIQRESYVSLKVEKEQRHQLILDACRGIKHPVAEALARFLKLKTPTSLETLKNAVRNDFTYLENQHLAPLVWAAGDLYSDVIEGLNRDNEVLKLIAIKEREIDALNKAIESKDLVKDREDLDGMLVQKNHVSQEIHRLLLIHANEDSHVLHAKLDAIAQDRIREDKIAVLQEYCVAYKSHPAARALADLLTYQTKSSLKALRALIQLDDSYQANPELEDAIWAAGKIYPEIIDGLTTTRQKNLAELAEINLEIQEMSREKEAIEADLENVRESLYSDLQGIKDDIKAEAASETYALNQEIFEIKKDLEEVEKFLTTNSEPHQKTIHLKMDLIDSLSAKEAELQRVKSDTTQELRQINALLVVFETPTAYISKNHVDILKGSYPKQYENYGRMRDTRVALRRLSSCIRELEKEKDNVTTALAAKPSTPPNPTNESTTMAFFKSKMESRTSDNDSAKKTPGRRSGF